MDERQNETVGTASTIAILITFFYLLVEITYKFITTKDILSCSWEIVLLIIISFVLFIVMMAKKEMDIPKALLGKTLTTRLTKQARKTRMKAYITNSLLSAFLMTIISAMFVYLGLDNSFKTFSIFAFMGEFISLFFISLLIGYFWYEFQVKCYNRYIKELDKDTE